MIDDYDIGEVLGRGGFATVHKARRRTDNVSVAIKIIDKSLVTTSALADRIINEIKIHSNIHHHHIVEVFNFFEDDDSVYIVLELCSGGNLFKFLKRNGKLSETVTASIIFQVLIAVQYLHENGVVHRDLKLSNILIESLDTASDPSNLRIKLCDFGLSVKQTHPDEEQYTVCGTPNYIAPEVILQQSHGAPADIWSVGCLLYSLLVGRPPFEPATGTGTGRKKTGPGDIQTTLDNIKRGDYARPIGLSEDAVDLISRLLCLEPTSRLSVEQILNHSFFRRRVNMDSMSSRNHVAAAAYSSLPSAYTSLPSAYTSLPSSSTPSSRSREVERQNHGLNSRMPSSSSPSPPPPPPLSPPLSPKPSPQSSYEYADCVTPLVHRNRGQSVVSSHPHPHSLPHPHPHSPTSRVNRSLLTEATGTTAGVTTVCTTSTSTSASTSASASASALIERSPITLTSVGRMRSSDVGSGASSSGSSSSNYSYRTAVPGQTPMVSLSNNSPSTSPKINASLHRSHNSHNSHSHSNRSAYESPEGLLGNRESVSEGCYSTYDSSESDDRRPSPPYYNASSATLKQGSSFRSSSSGNSQQQYIPTAERNQLTASSTSRNSRVYTTTSSPHGRAYQSEKPCVEEEQLVSKTFATHEESITGMSSSRLLENETGVGEYSLPRRTSLNSSWERQLATRESLTRPSRGLVSAAVASSSVRTSRTDSLRSSTSSTSWLNELRAMRQSSSDSVVGSLVGSLVGSVVHTSIQSDSSHRQNLGYQSAVAMHADRNQSRHSSRSRFDGYGLNSGHAPLAVESGSDPVSLNSRSVSELPSWVQVTHGLGAFMFTTNKQDSLLVFRSGAVVIVTQLSDSKNKRRTVRLALFPSDPNSLHLCSLSLDMQADMRSLSGGREVVAAGFKRLTLEQDSLTSLHLPMPSRSTVVSLRSLQQSPSNPVTMVYKRVLLMLDAIKRRIPKLIVYFSGVPSDSNHSVSDRRHDHHHHHQQHHHHQHHQQLCSEASKCMLMSNSPMPDFCVQWESGASFKYSLESGVCLLEYRPIEGYSDGVDEDMLVSADNDSYVIDHRRGSQEAGRGAREDRQAPLLRWEGQLEGGTAPPEAAMPYILAAQLAMKICLCRSKRNSTRTGTSFSSFSPDRLIGTRDIGFNGDTKGRERGGGGGGPGTNNDYNVYCPVIICDSK